MPLTDDIGDPIPQAPTCGGLTHSLSWQEMNELADAIERREYIAAAPLLQLPFFDAAHDPDLDWYMRARLEFEYAKPPQKVTIDPDDWETSRRHGYPTSYELVQETRETGGLRRAADLWARLEKAHKDFLHTKQLNEKEIAREKRASNKRELDYWSNRLAM
jgi:hypothetical protein